MTLRAIRRVLTCAALANSKPATPFSVRQVLAGQAEILFKVSVDRVGLAKDGQDVDEPKKLGLELLVPHRKVHELLIEPAG
jgi:hypothetical protein